MRRDGRMGGGGAGEPPQRPRAGERHAAIDDQALAAGTHLEGQAAGMGLGRIVGGRRPAGVGDEDGGAGLDALIAAVRRAGQRRSADVVIGEHGGELVGRRIARAVEAGEAAVALAEIAEHRHHPVDGRQRMREGWEPRAVKACRSGRRSSRISRIAAGLRLTWPPSGRIWRTSSWSSHLRRLLQEARLVGHRQGGGSEGEHRAEARQSLRPVMGGAPEVAHLPGQRAHEAPVEGEVAAVEGERRLGEPRDDAPRHDARLPGDGVDAVRFPDPLVDQAAGVGARDRHVGGAQVPQPSEAMQLPRPGVARRIDLEDREAVGVDAFAGEVEAAGIDIECRGRVGGPQVDRGNQQPFGDRAGIAPAIEEARVIAKRDLARKSAQGEAQLPTLTGHRSDRHQSPPETWATPDPVRRITGGPADYHPSGTKAQTEHGVRTSAAGR